MARLAEYTAKSALTDGCLANELPKHWREALSKMLMTIFVILLILWMLGMVTSYTLYGYIHILLIIAVAVLLIRLIQGRRAL